MTATQRVERLEPYLATHQVAALHDERASIESALGAPSHIASQIQDRSAMTRQLRSIERQIHADEARPYQEGEIDRAARRESELREALVGAMPTQAEMRRNPPGATDKERGFQRKHKADILEWKNLRKRLHRTGLIDDHPDAREVANLEQFRPRYSPTELNFDNAQIPGKDIFLPSGPIPIRNVMSDEERAAERASRDEWVAKIAADAAAAAALAMAKLLGIDPANAAASAPAVTGKTKN